MKTAVHGVAVVVSALGLAAAPRLQARESAGTSASIADAPPADSVVARALAASPEIAAARARVAAARTRARAARGLEDPMLEASYQDVGFPDNTVGKEEMSMLGLELRQPLPFFGKRGARYAVAEAEAEVAAVDVRTLLRRVESEVRGLYARLYSLDRRQETLVSADALLAVLADAAAARYAAGTTSMEAPLRGQLARSQLQVELQDVGAERRAVQAELARWLDRPADEAWGRVASLPDAPAPPPDWQDLAAANAPEVAARQAGVVAAERRVTNEQREGRPDVFAGAGYATRGEFDPVVTLRVGTALPLWRGGRQGPRVDAARAEAAMAREELRQARASARAAAARAVADWERSDAQVRLTRDAILPQSRMTLDAARAAYETGQVDFSTLIEDYEMWLTAGGELASREADRFAAWAELQALIAPLSPANEEGSR